MLDKVLIVGPSWIGDMVMTQSMAKLLTAKHPNLLIDILAPQWSATVASRMPEISQTLTFDSSHGKLDFFKRIKFAKTLQRKYDRAIVVPRSLKSALIPFFAKIKTRTGFLGEARYLLLNDILKLDKNTASMTVKKILKLGSRKLPEQIPYPELRIDKSNQRELLAKFNIDPNKKIFGLMPGAEYGPAKQWPAPYFAIAGKYALNKGYQVILFGSAKDKIIADKINANANNRLLNLCGKTQLADAIDLLALCEKVICNDSGLMHVAAAVGAEVHAIYGSSSPDYTPPLTTKKYIYNLHLECSPCFARACRYGHYNCLKQIFPKMILANI